MANAHQQLPKRLAAGETTTFTLDMSPPVSGWQSAGKLRIQSKDSLRDTRWQARLNGIELEEDPDTSESYDNPYKVLLGEPDQYKAWRVPAGIPKDGTNTIEIALLDGKSSQIIWLDMAIQ